MKLQPILYTSDMERAVAWYKDVLDLEPSYSSDMWTSFAVGDAVLGIHRVDRRPDSGNVVLSLVATDPLEPIVSRLAAAGVEIERGIQQETFGRSVILRDPDGSAVQVNEHEH